MSIFRFFWKVWLRLNLLTKDVDNDYIAEVFTAGKTSLRSADIARRIKDAGSELKYETILSVLDQGDRIIREQVQAGYGVLTDLRCYANLLTALDVSNNTALTHLYCTFNQLDAAGLDALFGTLHGNPGYKTVYIKDNPGTGTCTQSIATDKGCFVNATYNY